MTLRSGGVPLGRVCYSVSKEATQLPGPGGTVFPRVVHVIGDAEIELLPNDLRLFSDYFWQILANPGYFLATVWLILATLG